MLRFFATALAHALHLFLAATHLSKRPSTSGYSVRVELQSGLPPSPETCNTFVRRLSLHALHAMHGLFPLEWPIRTVYFEVRAERFPGYRTPGMAGPIS